MKYVAFTALAMLGAFLALGAFAQDEASAQPLESRFPREVTFAYNGKEYDLEITGTSMRKKFFVTVYYIASYLEKGSVQPKGGDKFQEIMQGKQAKQLTLEWVRNIEAQKVLEGYRQSFKNALGNDQSKMESEINQYLQYLNQDVKKGEQHILRWLPDGTVQVIIDGGEPKEIKSQPFAHALWSIWFSERSVVNREQLVSLLKG